MKKIIACIFISLLCSVTASANFNGSYEHISSEQTYIKNSGSNTLSVFEEYIINPFSSSVIKKNTTTCIGNNCAGLCGVSGCTYTTGYSVDGVLFNTAHPKFKSKNYVSQGWTTTSPGISTRIAYQVDSYTQSGVYYIPVQSVLVRKYYNVVYKHDTSNPTCGEVKYYNDITLTTPFTYNGGWLNTPKYFTMVCADAQTGCFCSSDDSTCLMNGTSVVSSPQLLGHNIRPKAKFTNKVGLTDVSCEPGGTFQKVLFDQKTPKVDLVFGSKDFELNLDIYQTFKTVGGVKYDGIEEKSKLHFSRMPFVNKIAGDTDIQLLIQDVYLDESVHGVSGVKSYSFKILRLTDRSFRTLSSSEELTTCSNSATYSAYNTNGNLTTSDVKNINISCNELQKAGRYKVEIEIYDWSGNEVKINSSMNIFPDEISLGNSDFTVSSESDKYANNSDVYGYTAILRDQYDNPIFNRDISSIEPSIESYSGGKTITVDSGNTALLIHTQDTETDIDGKIEFSLKSLKLGEYTQRFKFHYNKWIVTIVEDIEKYVVGPSIVRYLSLIDENTFNIPFAGSISVAGPGDKPEIGTLQKYDIQLNNIGNVTGYTSGNINISKSTLGFSSDHVFDILSGIDNTFDNSDLLCSFNAQIDTNSLGGVLASPKVLTDDLRISYRLGGEKVTYPLDAFGVNGCDKSTLGLKVIGNIQGDGKSDITGQESNFSDLSQSNFKEQIRKNAHSLVTGMSSGDIINGVKYIEGDVTISGEITGYETLIVRNGNIIISGNLNVSGNKLGLIVLKDTGYNLNTDHTLNGNIYVSKDVTEIKAIIFADGAFLSAKSSGGKYSDAELGEKLELKGALFTRNTIGGAISAGSDFLLPGGSSTTDRSLAEVYDLNFTRKTHICGDDYSFKIEYESSVQIDPPKGFSQ